MSTQIRIALPIKARLEEYQQKIHCKTHSDAIDLLMQSYDQSLNQIYRQEQDLMRVRQESITVGESLRDQYAALKGELGLTDSELIDLLMFNWSSAQQVDRLVFDYYLTLKRR